MARGLTGLWTRPLIQGILLSLFTGLFIDLSCRTGVHRVRKKRAADRGGEGGNPGTSNAAAPHPDQYAAGAAHYPYMSAPFMTPEQGQGAYGYGYVVQKP